METAFSQTIAGWHDFYITTATASATLVGLLFVAVSLHIDVLTDEKMLNAQIVARETFLHFIFIIAIALVFLVPQQTPQGTGIPLLMLGVIELALNLRMGWVAWRSRRQAAHPSDHPYQLWSIFSSQLGYLVMIVIALTILAGQTDGLTWLFPVILLLLSGAAASAWTLLLRLATIKRERAK